LTKSCLQGIYRLGLHVTLASSRLFDVPLPRQLCACELLQIALNIRLLSIVRQVFAEPNFSFKGICTQWRWLRRESTPPPRGISSNFEMRGTRKRGLSSVFLGCFETRHHFLSFFFFSRLSLQVDAASVEPIGVVAED
jgi:hypothetical protein